MATNFGDFINMAKSRARSSGGLSPSQRASSGQNFMRNANPFNERNAANFLNSTARNSRLTPSQRGADIRNSQRNFAEFSGDGGGGMSGILPPVQTPDGGRAAIANQDDYLEGVAGIGSSSPNRNEYRWNVGTEGRRERHQPVDSQTRKANQAKSTIEAAIGNVASKMQPTPFILENIAGNINRNISDLFPDQYYEIAGKINPGWSIADGISPLEDFRAEGPRHVPVATSYDPSTLSRYVDYDYPGGMNDFMEQTYPRRLRTSDVYGNEGAYHPRIDPDSEAGQLARLIESGEVNADPRAVWNLLPDGGLVYHHGLMPDEGTKEDFRQAMQREILSGNPFGQARPIVGPSLKWFQIPEYPNILPPREPVLPYQDEDDMYIYGRG